MAAIESDFSAINIGIDNAGGTRRGRIGLGNTL
jgi:hypothetical protein